MSIVMSIVMMSIKSWITRKQRVSKAIDAIKTRIVMVTAKSVVSRIKSVGNRGRTTSLSSYSSSFHIASQCIGFHIANYCLLLLATLFVFPMDLFNFCVESGSFVSSNELCFLKCPHSFTKLVDYGSGLVFHSHLTSLITVHGFIKLAWTTGATFSLSHQRFIKRVQVLNFWVGILELHSCSMGSDSE